jgi:hypothetical protein
VTLNKAQDPTTKNYPNSAEAEKPSSRQVMQDVRKVAQVQAENKGLPLKLHVGPLS